MPCSPPTVASVWSGCGDLPHLPMAPTLLICALGHTSLVTVLTRCGLPLPTYILADEKHSRCLTERVYLPTIVRVVSSGTGAIASPKAQRRSRSPMANFSAALEHEPSYQVRGP